MNKSHMIIRILVLAVAFGILFEMGPLWLRGGVVGASLAVLLNVASERTSKLNRYQELFEKMTKEKNGTSTRRKRK